MNLGVARRVATAAAVVMLAMASQLATGSMHMLATARAFAPLPVDPSMLPGPRPAAPIEPTEQKELCRFPGIDPKRDLNKVPTQQRGLDLPLVWQLSRGAGQTVAVIDTGVARSPRLPPLIPGGDYVFDHSTTIMLFDAAGGVAVPALAAGAVPEMLARLEAAGRAAVALHGLGSGVQGLLQGFDLLVAQ